MTVSVIERTAVDDSFPRCPDWCQTCKSVGAFTVNEIPFGPARLHVAVLLDGAAKVTVERYDEADSRDDVIVTLAVGAVSVRLTPEQRRHLRAALEQADGIAS